jgi:uncharacterized protein (DUF2384 family)
VAERLYRIIVAFFFIDLMIGNGARDTPEWMRDRVPSLGGRQPIHLSKTDPEVEEVIETSRRILESWIYKKGQ